MKKTSILLLAGMALFACKKSVQTLETAELQNPQTTMSASVIDDHIISTVKATGSFGWHQASDDMLWSALELSDHVLSIGYKTAAAPKDISASIHLLKVTEGDWAQARQQLLQTVLEEERRLNPSLQASDILAYDESTLPVLNVLVRNIGTIKRLRSSQLVRYADAMGYHPANTGLFGVDANIAQTSSSGCGSNVAEAGLTSPADFTTISPNARQSWNYSFHGIPAAWGKSSGGGRRIMIIDTGLSPDQTLFSTLWNTGLSSGRTVQRVVTLRRPGFLGFGYGSVETSTADACGHGTSMAGAAVSPRNASGGTVGVAYNAGLTSVRAAVDVLISESREVKGVADAFVLAGNSADVNIVSMSMGSLTSQGSISDAVNFAHNRGKLIFCAAGTSFGLTAGWYGVVFPANMSIVNAVTGVKDDGRTRCDACHDGSEVDFTVVMEKRSNGRKPLSTAQSGLAPSTVGGSSVATATTSAMAALIWSRFPTLTRDQVLQRMILSASNYPSKSGSLGWGNVNADLATN